MRRWKQVLLPVLCAALLLGLLVPASGAVGNVNLMAVNERVLMDLTVENMPRTVNGKIRRAAIREADQTHRASEKTPEGLI